MNAALALEMERVVRTARQELEDITARVRKEMSQVSATLKEGTEGELAEYAVEPKRMADMDAQIIGFIKPYREATHSNS